MIFGFVVTDHFSNALPLIFAVDDVPQPTFSKHNMNKERFIVVDDVISPTNLYTN